MTEKSELIKAYNEIHTELAVPVSEIKAKLMKLRSQLGREINKSTKTKSGQSTDELYKPTWMYWEKLQFLRPVMQPGKSRDNLQDSFRDTPSPAEDIDSSLDSEDASQTGSHKGNSTTRLSKKLMDMKRQELLTTCINVLKEPINKDAESKQVQCPFSLYVSEKLAQFDKLTRSRAEKKF